MANFNLNKVILGGRLTSEPELRQTNTGISVCSFSVAVNRRYASKNNDGQQGQGAQQTADFINVIAWRSNAEFVSRYFRKGSSICVVGSIQTRNWVDQQGVKRYATEVVADEINFVDSKSEGGSSSYQDNSYSRYVSDNQGSAAFTAGGDGSGDLESQAAPKFEEMSNDDDLPF